MTILSEHSQKIQHDILETLLARLDGIVPLGKSWKAKCPAHDDRNPSLSIKLGDRGVLLKCWAGCPTQDVLRSIGLDFQDLFFEHPAPPRLLKETRENSTGRPSRWNWRSQCAELERTIQGKRERHEAILAATQGMDINGVTVPEFDELMEYVGRAYAWLERCEQLDETLFALQQTLRAEEEAQRVQVRKAAA